MLAPNPNRFLEATPSRSQPGAPSDRSDTSPIRSLRKKSTSNRNQYKPSSHQRTVASLDRSVRHRAASRSRSLQRRSNFPRKDCRK